MVKLPGPIVDAAWLAQHAAAVVIADVRWYLDGRSGRAAYDSGHIPGARFVDLDNDLSSPPTKAGGRHPLPAPEEFSATLGRLGIGDTTPVVAYDDASGATAARLWWMLDAVGSAAAVLDGGIGTWAAPLEKAEPSWSPASFTARPWPPDRIIDIDQVDERRRYPSTLVVDARSPERYRGDPNPVDDRPGHVPGAVSAPFAANIGPDGLLLGPGDLQRRFVLLGARDRDVIAYCGSGVTACHDLLALRAAGLGDGRLFVGSWSAWEADLARPIEVGD